MFSRHAGWLVLSGYGKDKNHYFNKDQTMALCGSIDVSSRPTGIAIANTHPICKRCERYIRIIQLQDKNKS